EINRLEASGELEIWAKRIADHILIGLEAIWKFGASAVEFWQTLRPLLQSAADALGGWRNLALAVLAIPFRGVILGAAVGLVQFARGAVMAGRALAGIGLASAAGGALRLGGAFLTMLNPLNWVRAAFIAIRVAIISTGIGALVVGLAMAGTWIYNNWSGLVAFFRGFGEAFMASLGPARPLVEGIVDAASALWTWMTDLLGPIDASAETWASWGHTAGDAVGAVVSYIMNLPAHLTGLAGELVDYFSNINLYDAGVAIMQSLWDGAASLVVAMVDAISAKLSGIVPDWMKSAWNWVQSGDEATRARVAEIASRLETSATRPNGPLNLRTRRNIAASSHAARAAAAAGAIAAAASGPVAAAENPDGGRYVSQRAAGLTTTISAPIQLTVNGNVDKDTMPKLEDMVQRAVEELEERMRNEQRWRHD
ncbi:hypothetical protein, partial [Ruegeria sp. HKCCD8929]|uniref:hypothetical protein n=1 Tax=Ruegeria sp. HKCCD8929 TaxID=2683006 RepID=UPI001C2B9BB7